LHRGTVVSRHVDSRLISCTLRLLNWKAEIDFETGIQRTIRWYAEHREWWEKLLWMRSVSIAVPRGRRIIY
jgi:dTDP-D-glucose 4,6-dehydratase